MPFPRVRFGAPRRLMLWFVALLLLPAAAVAGLGVQLLRQERDLAARQRRERLEIAADRTAAGLEQALSQTERRLAAESMRIADEDDAVVVRFEGERVEAASGKLLYYPELPPIGQLPPGVFAAGEALEFQSGNPAGAAAAFRALARSPDRDARAGALLRLARNLRKLGQPDAALDAYDRLGAVKDAGVAGLPADLVARRARCAVLDEIGRRDLLAAEARTLGADLVAGRWRLDRGVLTAYLEQVARWSGRAIELPADRVALAAMTEWLWRRQSSSSLPAGGRHAARFADVDVTALWQTRDGRLTALAAGPRYLRREWLDPVSAAARGLEVSLASGHEGNGIGEVRRQPGETGLPWTIAVADSGAEGDGVSAARRRLLLTGLLLVLLIVGAGGYFIARAVGREFAVARLQTDFVAAVSHEFRTPLTSLQQFTALLSGPVEPAPEKRRTFYDAQARGIERLKRLVESLLDFGRMEAGAREYSLEPQDLAAIVRAVAADFQQHASGHGFEIAIDAPDDGPVVRADAEALGRAIWNLLDNAMKYSGAGRKIELAVRQSGGSAEISVRDEGLGIPRHEQAEIFDKFVRGEASRAHGIKGTGIGLAMVRHIITAHGGTIRVASEAGRGSTFTITLPAKEMA